MLGAAALAAALFWQARSRPAPARAELPQAAFPTRLPAEQISPSEAEREASPVSSGYRREVERPKPVQNLADGVPAKDTGSPDPNPGGPANRRRDEKRTLPEIFRMPPDSGAAAATAPPPAARAESRAESAPSPAAAFAPFGRLLKCQLIATLDSVTARSEPIVALVTQDLDWNGDVIIPAGTEVFSYAKPEPVIDASGVGRLVDEGEWTLVLPEEGARANGRELVLKARALDRRETVVGDRGQARSWGLDDGTDGLVGYTLSSLDDREIKLFAAAAISGMAQGIAAVAERQQPAPGVSGVLGATQIAPTIGNAAASSLGSATTEVMNQIVSRIREEISRRGVYVRVPAGKEFYLFVEQTIDPGAAAVGLKLPAGRRQTG